MELERNGADQGGSGATEQLSDRIDGLNAAVRDYVGALKDTRRSLDSDQLASLASPRARLEMPIDAVEAYLFTIDGVLHGEKLTGCLLAGECMLVRAKSEREAVDRANAGLRETVKLLHEEYETRSAREGSFTARFLSVDAGGRRNRPTDGEPLKTMPELRAMLERAFKREG